MAGMLDPSDSPAPAASPAQAMNLPPVGTPAPDTNALLARNDGSVLAAASAPFRAATLGLRNLGSFVTAPQPMQPASGADATPFGFDRPGGVAPAAAPPSNATVADTTKLNPPTAGPLYDSAHFSPADAAAKPVHMSRAAPLTGTLAEHMKNTYGVPMTTHDTREHDVRHMTLDEFVNANSHLTPMDIQMMTPMLPQQLSPHEQLIKGGLDIANTEAERAQKHPELYIDPQTKQRMTPAQVWFHYASQTGSFQNPYALNNSKGIGNLIGGGPGMIN